MNASIFFDPAQFGAPSERESQNQLIVNGRYMLPPIGDPTGKRRSLQRVTNFIKQLSEQDGLVKWKLRSAVAGLAVREDLYDLACSIDPSSSRGKQELDSIVDRCIDAAKAHQGSGGNETGTALHNLTDNVGATPLRVRAKWAPKVESYQRALHDNGLRVVPGLSERLVVSERFGTCGRLDDVYEDPWGVLRVGDRKSQKEFYTWWEICAQLALYADSDAMWNEQTCDWESMPNLADDIGHVAWMPLQHPGASADEVTIYDLPLEQGREVLQWCATVRELRKGARKWGAERELTAFARVARDIRDAETHEDLQRIHAEATQRTAWVDSAHQEMAEKRWNEIQAWKNVRDFGTYGPTDAERGVPLVNSTTQTAPTSVSAPTASPSEDSTLGRMSVIARGGDDFECRFDGKRVGEHPIFVPGQFHCMTPQPRVADVLASPSPLAAPLGSLGSDPTTRALQYAAADLVAAPAEVQVSSQKFSEDGMKLTAHRVESRGQVDAGAIGWDPAMFVAPSQGATFPSDQAGVPGSDADAAESGEVDREAFNHLGEDVVNDVRLATLLADARTRGEYDKASAEMVRRGLDGQDVLRKPMEWAAFLDLELSIQADSDGVWCKPMPMKSFRSIYAKEIAAAEQAKIEGNSGTEAEAARVAVPFTYSQHPDATVVNLPAVDDQGRPLDLSPARLAAEEVAMTHLGETLMLDSVSIKILKEVVTRAHNSKSSRGRVRLLNDLDKKYTKYREVLLPAVLAEWLAIDGGPEEDAKGVVTVANTASSREPAKHADLAGPITLTQFLASKGEGVATPRGESAEPAQDADEVRLRDSVDVSKAITLPETAAAVQRFVDEVAEIRKPYLGLSEGPQAGKHSMGRLVEMAQQAANGAERAKVFHEITRRKAWTGQVAAEINQYYLDNGYATVDFDPYFEATALPSGTATHVIAMGELKPPQMLAHAMNGSSPIVPAPVDTSPTAEQAIAYLDGAPDFPAFQLLWQSLSTAPCWSEQAVQEAVMRNMIRLK